MIDVEMCDCGLHVKLALKEHDGKVIEEDYLISRDEARQTLAKWNSSIEQFPELVAKMDYFQFPEVMQVSDEDRAILRRSHKREYELRDQLRERYPGRYKG